MKLVVSIPTYWARPDGWRGGDDIYDHPTPLSDQGTLARTLRSLRSLPDADYILVIVVVATAGDIQAAAEEKVRTIVRDADLHVQTLLLDASFLQEMHRVIGDKGQGVDELLSSGGYAAVRNRSLAAAQVCDADAVVLIDDDEVIEDPEFLQKVRDGLEMGISGLAGIYLNSDGGYLLDGPRFRWEKRLGKVDAMNLAFRQIIGRGPRWKPTPFAFGGAMIISSDLYRQVPFDPGITRGEDTDYLMNAMFSGVRFKLDPELCIVHLPPSHSAPAWRGVEQDALRFMYGRAKLAGSQLSAADFDPYPGPFLRDDLEDRISETLEILEQDYEQTGRTVEASATRSAVEALGGLSFPDAYPRYLLVEGRWQTLMKTMKDALNHEILTAVV